MRNAEIPIPSPPSAFEVYPVLLGNKEVDVGVGGEGREGGCGRKAWCTRDTVKYFKHLVKQM